MNLYDNMLTYELNETLSPLSFVRVLGFLIDRTSLDKSDIDISEDEEEVIITYRDSEFNEEIHITIYESNTIVVSSGSSYLAIELFSDIIDYFEKK